jgi:acetylornithine deacetylase
LGKATPVGAPWCSDAPILARTGIPTIVLGPGSVATEGHTRHESIPLDELMLGARLYTELVLAFSNQR